MVFGQSREEKLSLLKEAPKPKTANTTGTNTLPVSNIGIVNLEQKKKPHNINIQNHNPHEPKINPNAKYSVKQSYRRYKTKKEPNLLNKIQVNEDDDIVKKIKEAFGLKPDKPNTNYSEEITAPSAYNNGVDEPPIIETKMYESNRLGHARQQEYQGQRREQGQLQQLSEELNDITMEDSQALTYQPRWSHPMFSPDYNFETDDTPVKRIAKREQMLREEDFGTLPDTEHPLMTALATPSDRAKEFRMSSQLTPQHLRTPEQRLLSRDKDREYIKGVLNDADLSVEKIKNLTESFITRRRGRPEGKYGPYKKKVSFGELTSAEEV